MWDRRKKSIEALNTILKAEKEIIYEGFSLLSNLITDFNKRIKESDSLKNFGLTLLKGRHYCMDVFSLILDGLVKSLKKQKDIFNLCY